MQNPSASAQPASPRSAHSVSQKWLVFTVFSLRFASFSISLYCSLRVFENGNGFSLVTMQPFKRYVEIGRVALVNYGKDYGKLVVIVDVIDQNRALVDAPDMVRSQMNFKRLTLTDITIDIKRVPKKKTLVAAMEAADVKNKWENSSWGRKLIVQKRRACLNDFDRFKIMLAKIKRAGVVRQELAKLKKESTA
nr:60S ribosomal protein L14-1 [Ipomoea batatas]GMD15538.1 60S ribosomal protein L14-1 [Ipomoea batatas]